MPDSVFVRSQGPNAIWGQTADMRGQDLLCMPAGRPGKLESPLVS